ncbi:MAG: alpha/beta hydrolase [Bacteroidales bacterium]|nr:alpha/beta hydrolase [Bacteroidales bacterium]
MKRLTLILALFSALSANAQETYTFASRDTCDLKLDIYRPAPGAETTLDGKAKPAVMFAFGGGFVSGARNDKYLVDFYRKLNENGYPVVAIDYRLGMKYVKVGNGLAGAFKAVKAFEHSQNVGVEDVFSAVEYLRSHPELGIDTNNLVISGNSAGAIISLASEYAIISGECPVPDFNFKGVMSFAGAIISTEGAPKFKTQPCPILMFHGTSDKAVAYKSLAFFGRGLWGSSHIAKKLAKKEYPHSIYRYEDRTHDVAAYMLVVLPQVLSFLENDVIKGTARFIDATIDDPSLPSWGNISMDDIY